MGVSCFNGGGGLHFKWGGVSHEGGGIGFGGRVGLKEILKWGGGCPTCPPHYGKP